MLHSHSRIDTECTLEISLGRSEKIAVHTRELIVDCYEMIMHQPACLLVMSRYVQSKSFPNTLTIRPKGYEYN